MCTVIDPGMLTTVQDLGRGGYRAFGMPVSGVMDRYAFTMANILAGNERDAAVLEMTMRGGHFRFSRDAYIAVCGADMRGKLNGAAIQNWSGFYVPAESELAFDWAVTGCRTYIAFSGAIAVPSVMGSYSTYLRAQLGGFNGRALQALDRLDLSRVEPASSSPCHLPEKFIPSYASERSLRVMLGPQKDCFTVEGIMTFLSKLYTVSIRNDRMGYLLEGPPIAHMSGADIVSDALCPGAIQVPGNGMPIILAADCQTTGGYAKIATVIGPDLSKLAQAKGGDKIRFIQCNDEEAVAALREEQESYEEASRELRRSNDVID